MTVAGIHGSAVSGVRGEVRTARDATDEVRVVQLYSGVEDEDLDVRAARVDVPGAKRIGVESRDPAELADVLEVPRFSE